MAIHTLFRYKSYVNSILTCKWAFHFRHGPWCGGLFSILLSNDYFPCGAVGIANDVQTLLQAFLLNTVGRIDANRPTLW